MTLISDPTETRAPPPSESTGSKIKKALGPIGLIGVVILKFIGKIKFILPILLKTGGSMVLMVGVYASIWGWKWGWVCPAFARARVRTFARREEIRSAGERADVHSLYGRVHCP